MKSWPGSRRQSLQSRRQKRGEVSSFFTTGTAGQHKLNTGKVFQGGYLDVGLPLANGSAGSPIIDGSRTAKGSICGESGNSSKSEQTFFWLSLHPYLLYH
ncbi:hypothetical protein L6452_32785 [Arctium lappa]|uniref:Uncharacterized protein n=1 Tax=Arctium lappa TaxID=4217 RepID=A0ACB8Z5G8_ARCLA|nr:hypothetical protein L6452_32785 [Arctium lappa]